MPSKEKNRYYLSNKAKCPLHDGYFEKARRIRCIGYFDDDYSIRGDKSNSGERYRYLKSLCFGEYWRCPYYFEKE